VTYLGLTVEEVQEAISSPSSLSENLNTVLSNLEARGMREDVEVDLSIVRGLAYYTGVVFEIFDANLIEKTPHAFEKMQAALKAETACDVFLVLADQEQHAKALALASQLRSAGIAVSYSLSPTKFAKQFKAAEQAGATLALVVGAEFPEASLKIIATREEVKVTADDNITETLSQYLKK